MRKGAATFSYWLKIGTLISTAGFIGSVVIQIYARFLLESAPSWTEEASRFFFIYAISFAAGLAMKGNYYVYLDYFFDKLPKNIQKILVIISNGLVLSLFILMTWFSIQFIIQGVPEKSPSMGLSMSIAFVSIFCLSLSVSVFAMLKNITKSTESS